MYNSLKNAHKGYEYQDLIVGIALIRCLVNNWESVRVDKKSFSGDSFDDLVIKTNSGIFKYQIKHSETRLLSLRNLCNSNTGYLLKGVIASILNDVESSRSKYYLATNWYSPNGDDLEGLKLISNKLDLLNLPCKSYKVDTSSVKQEKLSNWISEIEDSLCDKDKVHIGQIENLTLHSGLPNYSSNLFEPGDLENTLN